MARRSARGPNTRPVWTRLGALAVVLVAIYAVMFATGNTTPKLGLDLQGGTSVVLTPKVAKGQKIPSGALDTAVDIIRERVDGLGVSEAEVVKQGGNIEISVPGKGRNDVVGLVGQTAELRFRQVATAGAAAATATTPKPSATPTTGATPKVTTTPTATAIPTATATPKATPTLGASPSATTRPEALSKALLAPSASTAPKATSAPKASTTPAASPGAAATPTPTPTATTPATTTATPPAYATEAYTKLTCTPSDVRSPKTAAVNDTPTRWIAACDRDGTTKYLLEPAKVVGSDVKTASATIFTNSQGVSNGEWQVSVSFTNKGQSKFTQLTAETTGQQVAIVLDGVVQSAPRINERIPGDAQISGTFTQKSATDLANVLKYGSLPIALQQQTAESVSATLGSDSLHAGLLAGGIGLALVVLYSFFYYRALGLVTVASLSVSAVLVYGTVVLLGQGVGFTLSLAGIAGLIVSIGVTADSFVVFYERLKDEAREGRSVRTSVERGWVRARRTILSADTVSFLAAAALYFLSIGTVRGFAFTLGVSTLLDVVVVFLFTKPVITLLVRKRFFSTGRFSGLTVQALTGGAVDPDDPDGPAATRRPTLAKRTPAGSRSGAGREV